MSELTEKFASANLLTDDEVRRIGDRTAAMVSMFRRDPGFAKSAHEKLGFGLSPEVKQMGKLFGLSAAAGAGVKGGMKAYDMVANKLQEQNAAVEKAKAYKEMINANPELKESGVDAKMVQRHFDTLHKFNPGYASDPMVAGSYVHNSMAYARPNLDQLNNVVRARGEIVRSESASKSHAESAAKGVTSVANKFLGR